MSFSHIVKDEICDFFATSPADQYILLGIALIVNGRFHNQQIAFSTAQQSFANILINTFETDLGVSCDVSPGKEQTTLKVSDPQDYEVTLRFLKEEFDFDLSGGRLGKDWVAGADRVDEHGEFSHAARVAQAAFLAGGSVADPNKAYHLELSIRRIEVAIQLQSLLDTFGIQMTLLRRYGYNVLYLKEGEALSDFLALTGAHISLLNFENMRMEKDLRNSVNRVVNCDTANLRRIANAAVRQLLMLRKLREHEVWSTLPQELRDAAQMRLDNPDCSLREMGEMMSPPLGKSGMNHRLKRLEEIAAKLD